MVGNDKGVTLIEILAATAILSIILISVLQFFPQISRFNQHNENKTMGINLAKEELVKWTHSAGVLDEPALNLPDGYTYTGVKKLTDSFDYLTFKANKKGLQIFVKIKKTPELSDSSDAHYVHIELKNHEGIQVTETYGYMEVPE